MIRIEIDITTNNKTSVSPVTCHSCSHFISSYNPFLFSVPVPYPRSPFPVPVPVSHPRSPNPFPVPCPCTFSSSYPLKSIPILVHQL